MKICRSVLEGRKLIDIIIVGVGKWEEYTKPCIESIQENEVGNIMLVDNGEKDTVRPICNVVSTEELMCYAKAMNKGMKYSCPDDWIIIINNDVLCTGPIDVSQLDKNTIYGAKKHERWGREWLDGWIFVFHRDLWNDVGEFDEGFEVAAFEDAD